jgi:hypothetical protein
MIADKIFAQVIDNEFDKIYPLDVIGYKIGDFVCFPESQRNKVKNFSVWPKGVAEKQFFQFYFDEVKHIEGIRVIGFHEKKKKVVTFFDNSSYEKEYSFPAA